MNKWKEVWQRDERINSIVLEALIKADGFDVGAGSFSVEDWKEYTGTLYKKMDIGKGDSVFDIGCGSGAFLYPLALNHHNVGGVDYADRLITLAKMVMPKGEFFAVEADKIPQSNNQYDIVVSHSAFQYFNSLDYAKKVILDMTKLSKRKIAIFDVNDENKRERYHQVRMMDMSQAEYAEKYQGLDHQFYSKTWFENIAADLSLKISIFDQSYEKYKNSDLRFNVIMEK